MVILPDVRGLHPYYVALAGRFAEAGFDTIAIDYFGRSAGTGARDDSFDWQSHIAQVEPGHVIADAGAAVAALRADAVRTIFSVGFCFGGSNSWRLAASDLELAGCIGFYGIPQRVSDVLASVTAPLLILAAGDDAATPVEEVKAMDAALTAAGKEHEVYVYDGAPHSFFDRSFAQWRDACADAWRRILDFTDRYADAAVG